jgi:hypothetical protein
MDASKVAAAGKVALGTVRVVSGLMTATGHGLLGGFLRNHHMMAQAARLGQHSVKGGIDQIKQGVSDLNG